MSVYAVRPAKPELQKKLRAMLDQKSLHVVASRLDLPREALLRYLLGMPLQTIMFRGIEVTLERTKAEPNGASQEAGE